VPPKALNGRYPSSTRITKPFFTSASAIFPALPWAFSCPSALTSSTVEKKRVRRQRFWASWRSEPSKGLAHPLELCEQLWLVQDRCTVAARGFQRQVQRIGHAARLHRPRAILAISSSAIFHVVMSGAE
jgi:hypothetical protein